VPNTKYPRVGFRRRAMPAALTMRSAPAKYGRAEIELPRVFVVLPVWIEHTTSPLPRECSTTELRQQRRDAHKT
jgi:hypothetical protein